MQSDAETQRVLRKKKSIIRNAIDKRISRFYCNLNKDKNEHLLEKELDEDFDSDELENYS